MGIHMATSRIATTVGRVEGAGIGGLADRIRRLAGRGEPIGEFLRKTVAEMQSGLEIETIGLHLIHRQRYYRCRTSPVHGVPGELISDLGSTPEAELFLKLSSLFPGVRAIVQDAIPPELSVLTGALAIPVPAVWIPIGFGTALTRLGETFRAALADREVQHSLHERVKELTCLYRIAQIAQDPGLGLDEVLKRIADVLPAACQYESAAVGGIVLDDRSYRSAEGLQPVDRLIVPLCHDGRRRGQVEVFYSQRLPVHDEGPFLREERALLEMVAHQIGVILESRQAEADRLELESQLRHADRLATLGQLAAGIAHELNEPLGNILGFAQ
jgi:signal transduction histidine kinase